MKETNLNIVKNIYKIVFDVSNIYDDILNEVMITYSNTKTPYKDLLGKMEQMSKSVKVILDESQNITSSMSKSVSNARENNIVDKEKYLSFFNIRKEISNNIINIAKDAIEAINIMIAYVIKMSSDDNISIQKQFEQNHKEIFKNISTLILQEKEMLYEQLINKIRTNIDNIHKLIDDLKDIDL